MNLNAQRNSLYEFLYFLHWSKGVVSSGGHLISGYISVNSESVFTFLHMITQCHFFALNWWLPLARLLHSPMSNDTCSNCWADRSVKCNTCGFHDDVIKWKHLPRHWPFVRWTHRSPVNSPHKGQWRGALMFSLIYAWINSWVNNGEADDFWRHRAHYDVIVMFPIQVAL